MSSNENTHLDSFGLPSREALETLYRMTDRVFDSQREKTQENPPKRRHELRRIFNRNLSDRPSQKVYIKLRNKDEDLFDLWSTKLNNCLMKPYKTEIRDAIDDLISKASANVGCKDFAKMIEIYSSHDLVSPAIKMAQTFMFLRNMTEAKIHIRLTDIEMGRSTIFLILIICVSKLVELSEILSFRLMEPIRRISDRPETVAPGPVCIAANLYEQVVDGLLELKRNKVTGLIIKDFDAHFLKVQERLYGIIEYMVSVSCMRTTVLRLLEDVIPRLPSSRRFYLAFWVESSPILQEEIFQEPSNSVGLFLIDEFHKQKEPETQSSRVQNKPEQRHDRPTRSRPQNQSTQSWENDPYFDWLLFSVMTEPSIMD
ncbi:hypothetical protein N7456_010600 [Penicillium angulare]|uniref:Uncharacterized protein n=1 Tax=Penicillium angulare TaxID=116970 RepID=A0A9W9K6D0_9EURO|nr:hypothetical protein N7456_010600 [Penicillium angulare]